MSLRSLLTQKKEEVVAENGMVVAEMIGDIQGGEEAVVRRLT